MCDDVGLQRLHQPIVRTLDGRKRNDIRGQAQDWDKCSEALPYKLTAQLQLYAVPHASCSHAGRMGVISCTHITQLYVCVLLVIRVN